MWQAPLRAGDCCFHSGWVVHGAGENRSDRPRRAMVVTYFDDGARCQDPFLTEAQEAHATNYCGGKKAGELADDDDANPILYQSSGPKL